MSILPGSAGTPESSAALVLPAPGDLRAITIRRPWTWALTTSRLAPADRKDTENRSWKLPARYTGVPVALHAGKAAGNGAHLPVPAAAAVLRQTRAAGEPGDPMLAVGAIIAIITFTGCHENTDCAARGGCSPWAVPGERFHWRAGTVTPLAEPVPCAGALSFWEVPGAIHAAILARLPAATRVAPAVPRPAGQPRNRLKPRRARS